MTESDRQILSKVTGLQSEVLARKNEIREGLLGPENWLDQSSEISKLRKLDAVEKLLLDIASKLSESEELYPEDLETEVLGINHDNFDNTA